MSLDSSDFFEERESHYTRFFGPSTEAVMHSTDLKIPHVDVYQFRPTNERPFWTLITGGMSNFPQPGAPDGIPPRAEIHALCVGAGWLDVQCAQRPSRKCRS